MTLRLKQIGMVAGEVFQAQGRAAGDLFDMVGEDSRTTRPDIAEEQVHGFDLLVRPALLCQFLVINRGVEGFETN